MIVAMFEEERPKTAKQQSQFRGPLKQRGKFCCAGLKHSFQGDTRGWWGSLLSHPAVSLPLHRQTRGNSNRAVNAGQRLGPYKSR
jgi:hypothetical protein